MNIISHIPMQQIEKRKNSQSTTIIASVVPKSQADKAGLKRGDIVCLPRSNGEQEVNYDHFLRTAKSGKRKKYFMYLLFAVQFLH